MANFCSNCGSPIAEGAKFCPNCGAALSNTYANTPSESQPLQDFTNTPKEKEDKVYFDEVVNKTRCVIKSTNWYVGEDKIIPVTSIAAVEYAKMGKGCGLSAIIGGILFPIFSGAAVVDAFGKNAGIIIIIIAIAIVVIGIIIGKKGEEWGEIRIQTNSQVNHKISCKVDEYQKCLQAMNKCLQENR